MARNTQSYESTGSGDIDHEEVLDVCQEAFSNGSEAIKHCFDEGFESIQPEHLRLLLDGNLVLGTCIELCGRESAVLEPFVRACAEICKACEEACEEYEGEEVFDNAVESYRECYEVLNAMVGGSEVPGWDEEGEQLAETRREGKASSSASGGRGDRSERTSTKKSSGRTRNIEA